MKIHCGLELNETDRRRVRAAVGRGGLATRREIRIFVERAVRGALEITPEPKVRRAAPAPTTSSRAIALEQLQALPDETVCSSCGRTKAEHGRMGLSCLPGRGRGHGGRFTQ